MHPRTPWGGWIEVVTGSMFSGKSEELIRRLRRAIIARQRVQVFKPAIDDRYSATQVVSHSRWRLEAERVSRAAEILGLLDPRTEVVGIDEGQFFDADIVRVCNHLADLGKRVIVAGLDMDFRGKAFGPMPELLAVAEDVEKMHAICARCGAAAAYTQRLSPSQEQVVVGEADIYEARCRRCFDPGGPAVQPELFPPGEEI
ncbi:MAG: thymidine kinase [Thermoanaerobaculaceae bacterium]|nr:thymidine kinase [Thermoanaerobaculaceae bacterium]MDI9622123.1 thymidine kinase [Acidobacteriota bacterium]NLH12116.1 thymidine kinase [Holophagae bacterium]HPW56121.1 thymidine kinase [Thermoanaerobaculaceae bacterium]